MRRLIGVAGLAGAVGLAGCGVTRFMDRDAIVAEPSACVAKRFEIYFADSEARLTEPAREAIGMTAAHRGAGRRRSALSRDAAPLTRAVTEAGPGG